MQWFIPQAFIKLITQFSAHKNGWLIIDDTLIAKIYAKLIEGIEKHFDSSTRRYMHGYTIVVLAWTNGKTTVPLDFEFWFSKDVVSPDNYFTKIQLAKKLIERIIEVIEVKGVLLDGLYASEDMMQFLNHLDVRFEMRMNSNRVIASSDGHKSPLRKNLLFKMFRNQHSKTVQSNWKGIKLYFTAGLRINKNGEKSIVFLVSNWDASSNAHVKTYALRWYIEMLFRTSKQYLELQHCSSRSFES